MSEFRPPNGVVGILQKSQEQELWDYAMTRMIQTLVAHGSLEMAE